MEVDRHTPISKILNGTHFRWCYSEWWTIM